MPDASIVIVIVVLLFSVVVHEVAHGYAAYKLGDPTAKMMGRLTLNPINHIDPVWTIIIPAFMYVTMGFVFGGAKPVPVNYYNLHKPKRDMAIVAAAGPLSNLILLILASIIFKVLLNFGFMNNTIHNFLFYMAFINAILMGFNLIPIPPLDGSKILMGFLTHEQADKFEEFSKYGFLVIFGILILGDLTGISIIGLILRPVINFAQFIFYL
ncbi:MAG: site-2 protease family protein [Candidatus Delongbacteria bacterium]|nr:site-2 protease family protein [Candidatus Delongbacteria bacterium]MBN2835887.1 site-2 protease family protein [Candidatus Delongbacteria bacterium]